MPAIAEDVHPVHDHGEVSRIFARDVIVGGNGCYAVFPDGARPLSGAYRAPVGTPSRGNTQTGDLIEHLAHAGRGGVIRIYQDTQTLVVGLFFIRLHDAPHEQPIMFYLSLPSYNMLN